MVALTLRILILVLFLMAALKWGDWKNWQKYYPTVLFVVVLNLATAFLTYHHVLWQYNRDILIKTHTTVEILNAFVVLPAMTFTFLSKLPFRKNTIYQYGYIALWVFVFGGIEFIAHYIVGTLSYGNGWTWHISIIFDIGMFSIIRMHYLRPAYAWGMSLLMTAVIVIMFDFFTGEFK